MCELFDYYFSPAVLGPGMIIIHIWIVNLPRNNPATILTKPAATVIFAFDDSGVSVFRIVKLIMPIMRPTRKNKMPAQVKIRPARSKSGRPMNDHWNYYTWKGKVSLTNQNMIVVIARFKTSRHLDAFRPQARETPLRLDHIFTIIADSPFFVGYLN